jgi:hypothetical protein
MDIGRAKAWAGLIAVSMTVGQPASPDVSALVARARLDGRVASWCGGRFRAGRPGAFALAMTSEAGGRYVVIEADATVEELAKFTGAADLACYTRAQAEQLDGTIGRSDTIHGRIAPRWSTTVVCGFVDATTSVCWQFDPAGNAFVKIGGWLT